MVRLFELPAPTSQLGDVTVLDPQKSEVVPQKPNLLQHTLSGQVEAFDHCAPQPGSHSLL